MRSAQRNLKSGQGDQESSTPKHGNPLRITGMLLSTLGILICLAIFGAAVYADFEASLFDIPLNAHGKMDALTCPLIIDVDETGIVQVKVTNESPVTVQRMLTAYFSNNSDEVGREESFKSLYDTQETILTEWEFSAADAEGRNWILIKVYLHSRLVKPAEENSCGVLVIDLPGNFTGREGLIFLVAAGLALVVGGGRIWWVFSMPEVEIKASEKWAVLSLVVIIVAGLFSSARGIFGLAVVLFYLATLMTGVMLPHFFVSRRK